MYTVAFTGHRPTKFMGGYETYLEDSKDLQKYIYSQFEELSKKTNDKLCSIVGGALGFDTVAFHASILTNCSSKLIAPIKIIIAEPFDGFWSKWPEKTQQEYLRLRKCANEVKQVSEPEYAAWKMQKRNEWMVDNCDELWAWWNGSDGGTKNVLIMPKNLTNQYVIFMMNLCQNYSNFRSYMLEQELIKRQLSDIYEVPQPSFNLHMDELSDKLGNGLFFDAIYGIPRGGLIPATMLSYKFDKPLLLKEEDIENFSKVLIVDDICCRGTTLFNYAKRFKNVVYASVYYRNTSKFIPDYCGHTILDNRYWKMPWES